MPITDILISYEMRKGLLNCLSAFDVAKLDYCLGGFLTLSERSKYLKPTRDLFWDVPHMEKLLEEGMELIILGSDADLLKQRIDNPNAYKHGKKLQVFLVGAFPVGSREFFPGYKEMLNFSVAQTACSNRVRQDRSQLRKLRRRLARYGDYDHLFLMSFGAPVNEKNRHWLRIADIPDLTVDLRVYVPCLQDRRCQAITVPFSELARLASTKKLYFQMLAELVFHSKTLHLPISRFCAPGKKEWRTYLNVSFPLGTDIEVR